MIETFKVGEQIPYSRSKTEKDIQNVVRAISTPPFLATRPSSLVTG